MSNFYHYLITDPSYYTNDLKKFEKKLYDVLKKNIVDIACFRDKTSSNTEELAQCFLQTCKDHNIKNIFINQDLHLAQKLCFDGIHLTSTQFNKIEQAKKVNLKTIISCHNKYEIKKAIKFGANMITYSPIFSTPNKGEPKGIEDLEEVVNDFDIDIIALGGITSDEQIDKIKETKANGFASIRYFI